MMTDAELYQRGMQTLLAAWRACAHGSPGATVSHSPGVTAAVFPAGPERAYYNNAVLERGLAAEQRAAALEAMAAAYAAAAVPRFAAWVHDSDAPMRRDLAARGYVLDDSTRAMGTDLTATAMARPQLELAPADWPEYLRIIGVPPGLLSGADRRAFRVRIARLDGVSAAAAMTFDCTGDCGIYNVATADWARRRGLATALTGLLLHDAAERGCRTASLQSTPAAERVYAAAGFRDLGRILEYVPADAT
jgi:ribosomal protein S18 acetylase RimI-like enzyme